MIEEDALKELLSLIGIFVFSAFNYVGVISETCTPGGDPFWPVFAVSLPVLMLSGWALSGVSVSGLHRLALTLAICLLATPVILVYGEMIFSVSILGHHPCRSEYDGFGFSILDRVLPIAEVGSVTWVILLALRAPNKKLQPIADAPAE